MSGLWVFAVYGSAALAAFLLLYRFRARAWYWHILSVLAALGVAMIRPPEGWSGPRFDVGVGLILVFFLVWGLAAPWFRKPRGA